MDAALHEHDVTLNTEIKWTLNPIISGSRFPIRLELQHMKETSFITKNQPCDLNASLGPVVVEHTSYGTSKFNQWHG